MAIALVQSDIKNVFGSNNTTIAFPSNVTAGNLLVVSIAMFQSPTGNVITTPTDTLGHTYEQVAPIQDDSTNVSHIQSWFVPNCSGGANTATADIGGTGNGELTTCVSEWSGVSLTSPLSGIPITTPYTSGTNILTGSLTPDDDNCLIYAVATFGGIATSCTESTTGGWAMLQEFESVGNKISLAVWYMIQGTKAPASESATLGASRTWFTLIAAFKPAIASQMPPPQRMFIPFRRS